MAVLKCTHAHTWVTNRLVPCKRGTGLHYVTAARDITTVARSYHTLWLHTTRVIQSIAGNLKHRARFQQQLSLTNAQNQAGTRGQLKITTLSTPSVK